MRLFLLIPFILFSVILDSLSQTLEIEVKRIPPDLFNICISDYDGCGLVRFTTSIPGLVFESNMDYIINTIEDTVRTTGDTMRVYTVIAQARPTQVIIIKGGNFVPVNVVIDSLNQGNCRDFIITELTPGDPKRFASFYLNSKPENATITIQGEPEFKKVTAYTIDDHASGVYQLTFSKEGFYPLENSIKIPEDGQSELTVSLIPIIDEDEVKKKIRGSIIINNRHFYQDNIKLGRKTVKKIVEVYPSAYQEVRSGSRRRTWGFVLAGFGGFAVGNGIGTMIIGETSELIDPVTGETSEEMDPVAGIIIGVASIAGGFLLIRSGAKKFVTGVEIYNSNLSSGASLDGIVIDFGLADHGIGFTAKF
jgi:hypothetical protein